MAVAIRVENLSKKYLIKSGHQESYQTLRDSITNSIKQIFSSKNNLTYEEFWALKNLNFEIGQGERVAIIGRNGAGKSTLLKILSRITDPSEGVIKIKGKVSSLLEVGTGFHPELTGRENIYLNGAILGMANKEIKKKFDSIVEFAEIQKFIDTPVKRYSSGMYVRLAFSVATHLEQEILIIDEVLAVGDSVFQKKCIDKMIEVSNTGKTILFVSHNFASIKSLCEKAFLLEKGYIKTSGNIQDVIDIYINENNLSGKEINLLDIERIKYSKQIIFDKIVFDEYPIPFSNPIKFKINLKSLVGNNFVDLDFGIAINDKYNNVLVHCSNRFINKNFDHISDKTDYCFEIQNLIKPGLYNITLFLRSNDTIQDWLENVIQLEILDGNPYNFNDTNQINGVMFPVFNIESYL